MLNFAPLFLLETSTARCLKVVYCPSPMTINIMGLFKLNLGGVKGGHTLQRWSDVSNVLMAEAIPLGLKQVHRISCTNAS